MYKKVFSLFGEYILKHMFASTKGKWFDKLNAHLLILVIIDKYYEREKKKKIKFMVGLYIG